MGVVEEVKIRGVEVKEKRSRGRGRTRMRSSNIVVGLSFLHAREADLVLSSKTYCEN